MLLVLLLKFSHPQETSVRILAIDFKIYIKNVPLVSQLSKHDSFSGHGHQAWEFNTGKEERGGQFTEIVNSLLLHLATRGHGFLKRK